VNLQPVHYVGVSVNVIWVTSQGPSGERVRCLRGQTGHKAHIILAPFLGHRHWHGKHFVPK